ncbi:MAG: hypothetical protein KDB79_07675 [Acidobacteria bacterium]|nr:hypothetical protein [Acidobacteriota bacterium]
MNKQLRILLALSFFIMSTMAIYAQRKPAPKRPVEKTLFAIVNDGRQIEPIAYLSNGKLKEIAEPEVAAKDKVDFNKAHYKLKTRYNVIFGGKNVGTATVTKDLAGTECAANQAEISLLPRSLKFKGALMALATDATPKKSVKGLRKRPTISERKAIETEVMMLMVAKKVPVKNTGELRYHNLTRIDVDDDGNSEFVGSYWYNSGPKKRSLLFFIAEQDSSGTISIPFSEFGEFDESNVMSGEIETLDSGVYHELLLDIFDVDGNGTGEIFTMVQGFEGSTFKAYQRTGGIWKSILETSNYHCGY